MATNIATDVATIPGLKKVWVETLGDPHVCIAILDGPVDLSHPSLAGARLTYLPTLVPTTPDGGPASQHGTHVTSVIFGQHTGPIKGIAPRCRGMIVPIFRDDPSNSLTPCSQIDLARAIVQSVQAGAHILNISGGQFSPSGTAHPLLADAVRSCATAGTIIVAAAGNQGCNCINLPAALPYVLAVGAMDSNGDPLDFSNWGNAYQTQGVLAPGEHILGASLGGKTATQSGTSYATAIVSGVTALLLTLQFKQGQKPDPNVVRKAILDSALGCEYKRIPDCRRVLTGRLDITRAVSRLSVGGRMSDQENSTFPLPKNPDAAPPRPPTLLPGVEAVSYASTGSTVPPNASPTLATQPGEPVRENPAEPASADSGHVVPAACGCGGGHPPQLVYALGTLNFDLATEARRDSIKQHMNPAANNPYDPHQLLAHLQKNPADAEAIIWTLNLDATPIYAVQPYGPFASDAYDRLRQFLSEQLTEGVERVSIPGHISGNVRLFTGQVVPIVHPQLRGMYSWTTRALVEAAVGPAPKDKEAHAQKTQVVTEFLERVYHELRNLGVTPQERAINHAATNAFNVDKIFEGALKEKMQLDTIEVERSPICRPDSDCWDVKLTFFDPSKVFERARKVHRFTVDVSDVVPVTVGEVRSWFVR